MNKIIGHKDKLRYFEDALQNDTLSHAYAFDGITGIGKSTFARHISKLILCNDAISENYFLKGSHPDYLYISEEDGKILSEYSDKINEFLSMKPSLANKKVIQIDDAEKMNTILQNKLLKTIEEPKVDAVFFLVSSNYELLIDTLKSRLIRISFNPLRESELKEYADNNNIKYDEDVLSAAYGSIGKFLSLTEGKNNIYEFDNVLQSIINKDVLKTYHYIKEKSEDENLIETLNNAEEYTLHIIKKLAINDDENIDKAYAKIGIKNLIAITDEIIVARNRLKRKQNSGFVITYLVHRMKEIIDDACNGN